MYFVALVIQKYFFDVTKLKKSIEIIIKYLKSLAAFLPMLL